MDARDTVMIHAIFLIVAGSKDTSEGSRSSNNDGTRPTTSDNRQNVSGGGNDMISMTAQLAQIQLHNSPDLVITGSDSGYLTGDTIGNRGDRGQPAKQNSNVRVESEEEIW